MGADGHPGGHRALPVADRRRPLRRRHRDRHPRRGGRPPRRRATHVDPAARGSNVQKSIFYKSWLAGTLGSTDSATAKKYGPELFKAQALTWREADDRPARSPTGQADHRGQAGPVDDDRRQDPASDPEAYEHLTGSARTPGSGYAVLSTLAALLALPFLLVSALLLLGWFLIVRLAVMLFPAFAVLGAFPAGRGLVIGLGRTVGAALVNAVIFGVGAGVTIASSGSSSTRTSQLPGLARPGADAAVQLHHVGGTQAVPPAHHDGLPNADHFGDAAGSLGDAARSGGRWAKKAGTAAAAAYAGNVAAAATINAHDEDPDDQARPAPVPDRVEARTPPSTEPSTLGHRRSLRTRTRARGCSGHDASPPGPGSASRSRGSFPALGAGWWRGQ